jgi:lactate dehydrogenase-like 2-hydroxyacid dehydrogenase
LAACPGDQSRGIQHQECGEKLLNEAASRTPHELAFFEENLTGESAGIAARFEAVAEFAIGLILALNRKYHRASDREREGNFHIERMLGVDLHGSTI